MYDGIGWDRNTSISIQHVIHIHTLRESFVATLHNKLSFTPVYKNDVLA